MDPPAFSMASRNGLPTKPNTQIQMKKGVPHSMREFPVLRPRPHIPFAVNIAILTMIEAKHNILY